MVRRVIKTATLTLAIGSGAACAGKPAPVIAPQPAAASLVALSLPVTGVTVPPPSCNDCAAPAIAGELAAAIEARVGELMARGGECAQYGVVLEDALVTGRITLRPFMWRVEGNLASAQGESSGGMMIARDIDSLNVGVRQLDDVLRSAEHEAAHIALRIASGDPVREARVDDRVNSCRSAPQR